MNSIATTKWFKKMIYQTNHVHVEKLLLKHEELRQSIRFIFMNDWKKEFEIISVVKSLYRKCFIFFVTIFSRSKQRSLKENDENDEMNFQTDDKHMFVIATERLQMKYCKTVLRISVRAFDSSMIVEFKLKFRMTFVKDYDISNFMFFDMHSIQWCKKFFFTFE